MSSPTLDQANRIIGAALSHSHSLGYRPMAVAIVDAGGNVKAVQREDGASMFRVDVALGKAWAAVAMDANSRVLAQRAKDMPGFFNALASVGQGRFIPQTGSVLIKDADGTILGAVGASGGTGDEDEAICIHGVVSVGLAHA